MVTVHPLGGSPDRWSRLDGARAVSSAVTAACVRQLPVDGAAVLLMRDRSRWCLAAATDAAVVAVEDLQQTLGEGPSVEAYVTGGPVLVPDLAAAAGRWPVLLPALSGRCAFFSFPLRIGAVRFGVLDLHRRTPGRLDPRALAHALRLADFAAVALVHHPSPGLVALDGSDPELPGPDFGPQIDQATGMLSVHLGVGIAAAYARLRGHAFSADLPLAQVAAAVVAGTLRLDREVDRPDGRAR